MCDLSILRGLHVPFVVCTDVEIDFFWNQSPIGGSRIQGEGEDPETGSAGGPAVGLTKTAWARLLRDSCRSRNHLPAAVKPLIAQRSTPHQHLLHTVLSDTMSLSASSFAPYVSSSFSLRR
jgi:hypothetical protein